MTPVFWKDGGAVPVERLPGGEGEGPCPIAARGMGCCLLSQVQWRASPLQVKREQGDPSAQEELSGDVRHWSCRL